MTALQNRFASATSGAGAAATRANSEYERRSEAFDPYAAAERSARGQFNSFRETLNRDIGELRGQQTGMGRLDTGWAQSGEDELVGQSMNRLNNQIMSNATNAAGMELSHIGQMGNNAVARSGMFYDMLSGGLDREQAQANARRAQRAGMWGAIGTVAGAGIGLAAGNPMIGAQVGGTLGTAAGGY